MRVSEGKDYREGSNPLRRKGGRTEAARRIFSAAGILLFVLAGCGTTQEAKNKKLELLWPAPPEIARIKFVGQLRNKDDLGRDARDQLVEVLLGQKKVPESLSQPMALVPSPDGKLLYVADYQARAVFLFNFQAGTLQHFGGKNPAARLRKPFGIAMDKEGNVYISDSDLKRVAVFDPKGKFLRNISNEKLERPTGIAIDNARRLLYVADSSRKASPNHSVHVFSLDGAYIRTMGKKGRKNGEFYFPAYVAVDSKGNLYVSDTLNARVQIFDPDGRFLRSVGSRGDAVGQFYRPKGVALDSFDNLYVVDSGWSNIQIFNPRGQVLLFFGARGRVPGLLFNPAGLAIDGNNRIYVADTFNKRITMYQLINTKAGDSFLKPPSQAKEGDENKAAKSQ